MVEERPSAEPRDLSEQQQDANPAAEIAQLRMQLRTRERQLAFLYKAGRELGTTLDIDAVMSRTVEVAREVLQAASGSLILLDEKGQVSGVISAVRDRPAEVTYYVVRQVLEQGLASWVVQHRRSALIQDTRTDARWIELRESVHDVRSVICIPLLYLDQLRGVLTLTDLRPGHFAVDHLNLLNAAAPQITIALENARLYRSVAQGRGRLEAILANMSDALFVVDSTGTVTLVNPALERLVGRPGADIVGQPFSETIQLEYEAYPDVVEGVLAGTLSSCELDLLLYNAAGQAIPVRLGCGPLPGERTQPSGAVIALRDVRYLKEVEQMREDMTDMLIHDLKAPLASISSSVQLLRQAPITSMGQESVGELLSIAEKNAWRLTRMVEAMLDVQRLEAGKFPLNVALLDVAAVIREVVNQVAPLAAEGGIDLRVDVQPHLPVVEADSDVVRRILWNLLDNALKYTRQDDSIRVKGESLVVPGPVRELELPPDMPAGQWVVVTVTDTGPGVDAADQERIFNKFAQARIARERRRGVGLGLAFCRLAVEAHGGRIWVDSRLGQGASFCFALQVVPTSSSAE